MLYVYMGESDVERTRMGLQCDVAEFFYWNLNCVERNGGHRPSVLLGALRLAHPLPLRAGPLPHIERDCRMHQFDDVDCCNLYNEGCLGV